MVVVVVGGVNADVVVRVDRRPDAGETVVGDGPRWSSGGKGANMAVAAAAAGADVALCGAVGDDPLGRDQVAALAAAGVGTERVRVRPDLGTGVALIVVTPDGENSIVVGGGANLGLDPAEVEADVADACGADQDAAVVLAQAEVGRAPVDAAARAAGREGARLVLSPAPVIDLDAESFGRADPVVVNADEADALLARHAPPPDASPGVDAGPVAVARALVSWLGCRSAVVTLGAEGAVVADDRGVTQVLGPDVPASEVVDTTGAGDVLAGVIAARLAAGDDLLDAVGAGCAVAAESVRRPGAR